MEEFKGSDVAFVSDWLTKRVFKRSLLKTAGADDNCSLGLRFKVISYPDLPWSYGREIWESSILSMLSASEARNTGFFMTAHVRTLCCDFG